MGARVFPANPLPFNLASLTAILSSRLERQEAACRARMLLEDVPRLGGPLRLQWFGRSGQEAWPYYILKNNTAAPHVFRLSFGALCQATGYVLDWGDLVTLSKVVKLARRLWGRNWTRWFRERMRHFNNHISTVEELWWLGLWQAPTLIERECAYCVPYWRSVDWQFQTQGVVINLEVKYRPHDWLRFVDPPGYAQLRQRYFDDLVGKFPAKCAGQVNLVGMTLLGSLGSDLRQQAEKFLESRPPLDGFLFWNIGRRDSLACDWVLRPGREFVRELVRPASEEDRWRNPFIICTRQQMLENPFATWPEFDPLAVSFRSRGQDLGREHPTR